MWHAIRSFSFITATWMVLFCATFILLSLLSKLLQLQFHRPCLCKIPRMPRNNLALSYIAYLLLHGRGHQSWLSWLARRAWCLLQVAAVQFLLLERETLADHYRATPCQVPATWQGRIRFRCGPRHLPQIKCFAVMTTIMTRGYLWRRDSLEKLWQQGVPWTAVLFQREKQLEGGHCTGVTLDGPYPPAHVVILEVNEESASPENIECHISVTMEQV